MYFQKIRHPANFRFADQAAGDHVQIGSQPMAMRLRELGEDVFHLELTDPQRWPLDPRLLPLHEQAFSGPGSYTLQIDAQARLRLRDADGAEVLSGLDGAGFGVCGEAWMFQWQRDTEQRFYGQGEKWTGLEKTGRRTKFWNLDVWGDHAMPIIVDGQPDPLYAAIPYLLVRSGSSWVGILVDHPGSVFMDTGSSWLFTGRPEPDRAASFWFGADHGVPAFYLIAGADPATVTRKLQRLVGLTPLPPLWSLGHHQCRWGYRGTRDLMQLDQSFTEHAFPCDGLWLDIDYMERYKVFTTSREHFGDRDAEMRELEARGRRIVPILDPGVKVEPGYAVAQSGIDADIFCRNPEGMPYVGFVWPGATWFPDFSLPQARDWWAGYVAQFRNWGFHGAWIDMNDPSVGAAELDDMRFQRGAWEHWTYHNLYATGMAQATYEGFLQARPQERPFVLSRSAATGSSRWAAVWTGDNVSNWHHLRNAVSCTLNLALSGIPFNGPDVPGFGGHADAELAVAWYKAGFLFPFLRNHADMRAARQEPWVFGPEALDTIRHMVRLRYKLLPYLYQLWIDQSERGEAVLRPLFMEFGNSANLQLDHVDDQFMVGPAIMQAPLLRQGEQRRHVVLPGAGRWFDASGGTFVDADRTIQIGSSVDATPMYWREGQIIPMQLGERVSQANDCSEIELHVVLGRGCTQTAELVYRADDGSSFGYRDGARSAVRVQASRDGDRLRVRLTPLASGWKPLRLRVVGYDGASEVECDTPSGRHQLPLQPHRWRCSGAPLHAAISGFLQA